MCDAFSELVTDLDLLQLHLARVKTAQESDSEYDAILKAGLSMLAALIMKEFEESSMFSLAFPCNFSC